MASHLPRTVSTGVPGLDHLLRGGLPANRLHLIEGSPGTGKTTLALQFLLEGARRGERGVYVTLSETDPELRGVAESHGWSLDGVDVLQLETAEAEEDQYTLYHPSEVELSELTQQVLHRVQEVNPTRVAFDSLSELRLLARDPLRFRRQLLGLKQFFAGRACTVLILDDLSASEGDGQLQSLAHGVISIEQRPIDYGLSRRRLSIAKMRGVPFIGGFHDIVLRTGGLTVYPRMSPSTAPFTAGTLSSGLPGLDALLGGGLTFGTTSLVIGPAGTGKSTISAQYVAAAARSGIQGAIYLFDERVNTFLGRAEALGLALQPAVDAGTVTIEQIEPGMVGPGELAARISSRVDEGARVVLLDSLNGYIASLPDLPSPTLRLYELLANLNSRGVATLLLAAQHGIIGASMPVPLDVSYIADVVVLLRFYEWAGAVRRAISVVKKRTGRHESTIRELVLDGGIRVGETLRNFRGVLTGVPAPDGAPRDVEGG